MAPKKAPPAGSKGKANTVNKGKSSPPNVRPGGTTTGGKGKMSSGKC